MELLLQLLPGVIWSAALGLAVGNYACSIIHRLPRKLPILLVNPYCGSCKTFLATKDLFPFFSWFLLKGKCRYCHARIPSLYTWVEGLVALTFIVCYLQFDFSETYILVASAVVWLLIYAAICLDSAVMLAIPLLVASMCALLLRVLTEHAIYPALVAAFVALIMGVGVWRFYQRQNDAKNTLPPLIIWLVAVAVALPMQQLVLCFMVWLLLYPLTRKQPRLLGVACAMAMAVPLLFPQLAMIILP